MSSGFFSFFGKINMEYDISRFFAQPEGMPFSSRKATMPWAGSVPIDRSIIQQQWSELQQIDNGYQKTLLYLHIPFCETHCKFCGFYQNRFEINAAQNYTEFLLKEIQQHSQNKVYQQNPIQAVYFGGGTPTALSTHNLLIILQALKSYLPLASDCEITIETRVSEENKEKLAACFAAGANRISIGVQTFDTDIRRKLGRQSTQEQVLEFIDYLIKLNQGAIVCDLLFGLPGQTSEVLTKDLEWIESLQMDGVDLYALNVLPNTILGKSVAAQRISIATFEEQQQLYLQGLKQLTEYNWQQISNSHWARNTRERNLYNLLIKEHSNCLAFGCAAGGNIGRWSFMQQRELPNYYQQVSQNQKPIAILMQRPSWADKSAVVQGGIEKGFLACGRYFNAEELSILTPLFEQWQQSGLCLYQNTSLRLTSKGRFWASQLLNALQQFIFLKAD
ncbi:heme anaerobic degradation radical SAM methyltransferase ChuW/HutW [Testudinibacter aquarius]|uniref:Heme anaerobic degradation radical SAM methyltransferase ChuW/HutW n=2 Tax=Testudinibacter aquarius TaxID=1524974 RepID=A0ABY2XUF5_9PAST|nr:heme anaerobic degradation radical SAM methyltransferase ChuW/HutW [Testudinibacter aquarius]